MEGLAYARSDDARRLDYRGMQAAAIKFNGLFHAAGLDALRAAGTVGTRPGAFVSSPVATALGRQKRGASAPHIHNLTVLGFVHGQMETDRNLMARETKTAAGNINEISYLSQQMQAY